MRHTCTIHTEVANMKESESSLQWNSVRPEADTACHRVRSSVCRCNNLGRFLHHRKPDPMTCDICLLDPLSRISRCWLCACNNKRVRASETFPAVAFFVASIDYRHLQKQGGQSTSASLRTENRGWQMALSAGRIELQPAVLCSNHVESKPMPFDDIILTSLCLNRVFCMRRFPFDIGSRLNFPRRHTDLQLLERYHLPAMILSSQ